MRRSVIFLSLMACGLPGAGAAQDVDAAPQILDVRHVRHLWKVRFQLPRPAHVVVLGWSDHAGAVRHYPRAGADARDLPAGTHWLAGDPVRLVGWHATRRAPTRVRYSAGPTYFSPVLLFTNIDARNARAADSPDLTTRGRLVAEIGFLAVVGGGRFAPVPAPVWRVHLFTVPRAVSAREVDAILSGIDPWHTEASYMALVERLLGATARAPAVIAPD